MSKKIQFFEDKDKTKQIYPELEKINITSSGTPIKTGFKLEDKDVYIARYHINTMPTTGQTKKLSLGFNLSEVNVFSMNGVIHNNDTETIFPINVGDINNDNSYSISFRLQGADNTLLISSGTPNFATNSFDCYINILFTYKN